MKSQDNSQAKIDKYTLQPKYAANSREQKELKASIALNLVVDCDMPPHWVERKGFIRHHETINPKYNTVYRYLSRLLMDMLHIVKL